MAAIVPILTASRGAGGDLTATTASSPGGDTFPPGNTTYLRVKNGSTVVCTVSVLATTSAVYGLDNPGPGGTALMPLTLLPSLAANTGDRLYGPFPSSPFANASTGQVHVSYTTTTSVTVQVLNLGS